MTCRRGRRCIGGSRFFHDEGRFEKISHALLKIDRERVGRQASPTAAIIGNQSVKTTEAGVPRGYDAGKKIKGRKRHALVDTNGRALVLEPHRADIQDRNGAGLASRHALRNTRRTKKRRLKHPCQADVPKKAPPCGYSGTGACPFPFVSYARIGWTIYIASGIRTASIT
jgi:hypothetical protein